MELYLHYPFCRQKCRYCDFLSAPADDHARASYLQALCHEIQGMSGYVKGRPVKTIFIGGGTPSLMTPAQLVRLMDTVRHYYALSEDCEITLEANPGTVTREFLYAAVTAGINRLSLGLQSADERELKILGRIHTFADFEESFAMARAAGIRNINIDLIFAVPGQTVDSWKRTLQAAVRMGPEHISAYSLIIEEGTPFYEIYGDTGERDVDAVGREEGPKAAGSGREDGPKAAGSGREDGPKAAGSFDRGGASQLELPGTSPVEPPGTMAADQFKIADCGASGAKPCLPKLPDEDTEREMYELTEEFLGTRGYERYEISNYAKPGFACRHNIGYWKREEYLGLGLGAASLLGPYRFENTRSMSRYLKLWCRPDLELPVQQAELSDGHDLQGMGHSDSDEQQGPGLLDGDEQHGAGHSDSDEQQGPGLLDNHEHSEMLSREEEMSEFIILGLRMTQGIYDADFYRCFGVHVMDVYGGIIRRQCQQGLLIYKEETGQLMLTKRGTDISNYVLCEYI